VIGNGKEVEVAIEKESIEMENMAIAVDITTGVTDIQMMASTGHHGIERKD